MKVQEAHSTLHLPGEAREPHAVTARLPGRRLPLLIWGVLRLPALALLLYLLREPVIGLIERVFDIGGITILAIKLLSTPLSRGLAFTGLAAALLLTALAARRLLPAGPDCFGAVAAGSGLILLAFTAASTDPRWVWPAVLVLAANWVSEHPGARRPSALHRWHRASAGAVGVAELLFLRHYLDWIRSLLAGRERPAAPPALAAALPGALAASLVAVLLMDHGAMVRAEQALRMPPEVRVLASGDFNGIGIDAAGRHLYVTGHGVQRLRRHALADFSAPPLLSSAPTDGAQGFAYDAQAGELHVYNLRTRTLMTLDAQTLALRRSLPLPELSPGDPWIAVDPRSGTIALVSEADRPVGTPFLVLDRASGEVLDRRQIDPGNVLMHPDRPLLYLSFFRNSNRLMAYDLLRREVVRGVSTDARADRMAFLAGRGELLLASPLRSRILRFDAETLQPRGSIGTVFGVRVMALDVQRGLMLAASLATGQLAMIDLASGETRRTFYLGPWLRTIALDADTGTAYVSSQDRLYEVRYGRLH